MNIKEQAHTGKIMSVPLNGSPRPIEELPEGFTPHYSGAVLILAEEQVAGGDINLSIKTEFSVNVVGDAVVISQAMWHKINP